MKALLCLCACAAVLGCNSRDASNISDDAAKLARDATASAGSVTLAGKVNMVLALRKGVDMTGLHVDAKDGVVTVSGHVDDQKQKDLVLTTVDSVKGVDTVVDKLNIGAQPVRPDAGN